MQVGARILLLPPGNAIALLLSIRNYSHGQFHNCAKTMTCNCSESTLTRSLRLPGVYAYPESTLTYRGAGDFRR